MNDIERKYIEFASKISFFEFIQEEFRQSNLNTKVLKNEIKILRGKKNWNINELADYIKQYPKSFLIFQEIVQLLRFTNAQLIHFAFDTEKLNSIHLGSIFEYMIYNIKYDEKLRNLYLNLINKKTTYEKFVRNIDRYDKKYLITVFKKSVSKYIYKIKKDFSILEQRVIRNQFADFSIRLSNYLLNNFKLNETLESINIESFLRYKKIPIDTKSIHGNFAKIKISNLLESNGFTNINSLLENNRIKIIQHDLRRQMKANALRGKKIFCVEKYVEGIIKSRDKKLKKFDLIIFRDLSPKYLFEINFYSTEGTKIGINQGEYIDLLNYIKQNFKDLEFYWITDGNYWLTPQGESMFKNLLRYFDTIYNINHFADNINRFK